MRGLFLEPVRGDAIARFDLDALDLARLDVRHELRERDGAMLAVLAREIPDDHHRQDEDHPQENSLVALLHEHLEWPEGPTGPTELRPADVA